MIRLARGVRETASALAHGMATGRALRLVNYHSTPRAGAATFEREIAGLARTHDPLDAEGLERMMDGEVPDRPHAVPILFEGFRDNYDVILPIIEAHGLTAWLFVPPAFIDVPAAEQRAFAARQTLIHLRDDYPGERIAMSWQELRDVHARGHVIACHTRTHTALIPGATDALLEDEIVRAKSEFDAKLGTPVEMFCFLRGAEIGVDPRADAMLRQAGYRYLLSNFRLQRLQ